MRVFRNTIRKLEIHPSARKHGIDDSDIEHAVMNAICADKQEDRLRLYIGPAQNADLLEVVTVDYGGRAELAIHAMRMRPKYIDLLWGE